MPPKQTAEKGGGGGAAGKALEDVAIVWFRKCLRLDDNQALVEAAKSGVKHLCPVFVIDPHFGPDYVGVNRYRFLLESLTDLDKHLRSKYKSRLLVLRGKPEELFGNLLRTGKPLLSKPPRLLLWERDTEPYAIARDKAICELAEQCGIEVQTFVGHTLYDTEEALRRNKGKAPSTMPGIVTLVKALGEPPQPLAPPSKVPTLAPVLSGNFDVPTLKDMGYKGQPTQRASRIFPGGESAGSARMAKSLKDAAFIRTFEKPKTRSTAFDPLSTTGLSPYLKFGCVSVRRFYHGIQKVIAGQKHSQPPGSLVGQLYFREMAYLQGLSIPNFDKQVGNPACKQIPWSKDAKSLKAWEEGRTGFPFIDAAMRQLKEMGWLHHLARHAVACFLTRGDLWISWEEGRDVFDRLLLDADWALNNMNWLALAGVASWSPPFFRVYNPVPKMDSALSVQDPEGKFIREFVPELKNMPSAYIYAPWNAPLEVQQKAKCVIGRDYPKPIVNHEKASQENMARFKKALSSGGKRPAAAAAEGGTSKKPRKA